MKREPVTSSNIAAIGFDPATQVLEIEFTSGGMYQYAGVAPAVYAALMDAESKGEFFNRQIKHDYACTKVDPTAPVPEPTPSPAAQPHQLRIIEVQYQKTFNIGNYENERIAVTATIDAGEDAGAALAQLRAFVYEQHLSSLQGTRFGQ